MKANYATTEHPWQPNKVLWTTWVGNEDHHHLESLQQQRPSKAHVVLRQADSIAHIERMMSKAGLSGVHIQHVDPSGPPERTSNIYVDSRKERRSAVEEDALGLHVLASETEDERKDFENMTKKELERQCRRRGLNTTGKVAVLRDRLNAYEPPEVFAGNTCPHCDTITKTMFFSNCRLCGTSLYMAASEENLDIPTDFEYEGSKPLDLSDEQVMYVVHQMCEALGTDESGLLQTLTGVSQTLTPQQVTQTLINLLRNPRCNRIDGKLTNSTHNAVATWDVRDVVELVAKSMNEADRQNGWKEVKQRLACPVDLTDFEIGKHRMCADGRCYSKDVFPGVFVNLRPNEMPKSPSHNAPMKDTCLVINNCIDVILHCVDHYVPKEQRQEDQGAEYVQLIESHLERFTRPEANLGLDTKDFKFLRFFLQTMKEKTPQTLDFTRVYEYRDEEFIGFNDTVAFVWKTLCKICNQKKFYKPGIEFAYYLKLARCRGFEVEVEDDGDVIEISTPQDGLKPKSTQGLQIPISTQTYFWNKTEGTFSGWQEVHIINNDTNTRETTCYVEYSGGTAIVLQKGNLRTLAQLIDEGANHLKRLTKVKLLRNQRFMYRLPKNWAGNPPGKLTTLKGKPIDITVKAADEMQPAPQPLPDATRNQSVARPQPRPLTNHYGMLAPQSFWQEEQRPMSPLTESEHDVDSIENDLVQYFFQSPQQPADQSPQEFLEVPDHQPWRQGP